MCLFCDIVNGTIPTNRVYEDEKILVFPDIKPTAPTHLLLIPKIHMVDLRDIDSQEKKDVVSYIMGEIPKIVEKLSIKDFQLLCRNGKDAGQEIFHLHFHLLSQTPYSLGN